MIDRELDVYPVPDELGGGWAWRAAGVTSDGYENETDAMIAASWYLIHLAKEAADSEGHADE